MNRNRWGQESESSLALRRTSNGTARRIGFHVLIDVDAGLARVILFDAFYCCFSWNFRLDISPLLACHPLRLPNKMPSTLPNTSDANTIGRVWLSLFRVGYLNRQTLSTFMPSINKI